MTERWVAVGRVAELTFAPGATVEVEGVEIAIFRHQGTYHALQNSCPHAGGALAEGEQDGASVRCPWHGWSFDLHTGECNTIPEDRTRSYPVREVDGALEVAVA